METEWQVIRAEDFCSSVRDGTHDSPKPVPDGRLLVTSRHIVSGNLDLASAYHISEEDYQSVIRRSKVDRWDVLISMIGTVGEPCLVKEEPNFAIKNVGLFKSKGETEGKWLYYYLRSPFARQLLRQQSRGTTQQYIPLGALRDFPVLVPRDPEQMCAIVHILGTLDDKIELNRQINATLEAIARALFKSWFVDFDPVAAKAAGRDPGLPPDLAALFPDRFEDSDLGDIPAGWEVQPLDSIANYLNGLALQKFPPRGAKVLPVIKIAQMRKNSTDGADLCSAELPEQYIVQDGDVLFSWSGSLEVMIWTGGKGALNQHLFKVTSERYPKWFYYLWTRSHLSEFQAIAAGKATTMGHIQRHHLTQALVVAPPPDTLSTCSQIISPLLEQYISLTIQSRTLADLRDTLLPKLLSGDLRVPDAERLSAKVPL